MQELKYTQEEALSTRAKESLAELRLPLTGWEKSIVGFTNEVWLSSHGTLKIYRKPGIRQEREKAFYRLSPISTMPKALAIGKDYLLMENVQGDGFFRYWPEWSPEQRKQLFSQACDAVGAIMDLPMDSLPGAETTWPEETRKNALESLQILESEHSDQIELLTRCRRAWEAHEEALFSGNDFCWLHRDFHLDNLLWNEKTERFFLLDFEDVIYAPADVFLDTPLRMLAYPFLYANEIDDPRQRKEDYEGLFAILQAKFPRCFAHPRWQERVALYSLQYNLRHLRGAPKNKGLLERLERNLNQLS